ncbi:MAG TPA: hypothetical protein VM864_02860 [Pyrinomonadaceae bacterium]|jgi:hypothetical protein|nr:hypothetical protein [Pyrinomonadaceae bacterium]
MLFVESRVLDRHVDGATRTAVLEKLEDRGLTPLVRTARLNLFDLALLKSDRARQLESAVASRMEAEGDAPYVRGDLFCFRDYAHFLVFGDADGGASGVRVGIIYETETTDPAQKLEEFCQNVADSLRLARGGAGVEGTNGSGDEWRERDSNVPESFARFAADEGAPLLATRGEMVEGWLRAAGMLEDSEARRWLSRLNNSHQDGRAPSLHDGEGGESVPEPLLRRFTEAGLVRREILVSCRKAGRALFRLPSPDALAVLGNAVCSECGASVADEQAEEVVVPTSLTTTLLQDSSWLTTHLRAILSNLGLPETQIAARQAGGGESDVQMMANVCGEPFLFLLRDGDWTATHARRAAEDHSHAEDAHLVVIATGRVTEEARQRLREHVRRLARVGRESELIFVEGLEAAHDELQPAFERACERALGRELWELDASLGMSVGFMMAARSRLLHGRDEPRDVAASAASAAAGSLAEF